MGKQQVGIPRILSDGLLVGCILARCTHFTLALRMCFRVPEWKAGHGEVVFAPQEVAGGIHPLGRFPSLFVGKGMLSHQRQQFPIDLYDTANVFACWTDYLSETPFMPCNSALLLTAFNSASLLAAASRTP